MGRWVYSETPHMFDTELQRARTSCDNLTWPLSPSLPADGHCPPAGRLTMLTESGIHVQLSGSGQSHRGLIDLGARHSGAQQVIAANCSHADEPQFVRRTSGNRATFFGLVSNQNKRRDPWAHLHIARSVSVASVLSQRLRRWLNTEEPPFVLSVPFSNIVASGLPTCTNSNNT